MNRSRKELRKIILEYQNQINLKNENLEKVSSVLNMYERKIEIFQKKEKKSNLKIEELESRLKKNETDNYKVYCLQEEIVKLLSDIETLNTIKNEKIKSLQIENFELTKQVEKLMKQVNQSRGHSVNKKNGIVFKWIRNWIYRSPRVKKVYRILFVK